jgi:hypothetical protein
MRDIWKAPVEFPGPHFIMIFIGEGTAMTAIIRNLIEHDR